MSRRSGSSNFLLLILIAFIGLFLFYQKPWSSSSANTEEAVQRFIENNPEKVIAALQAGQNKMREKKIEEGKKLLTDKKDEIYKDNAVPFAGNPDGDVVVVEFFDYQCGYCKKVFNDLTQLLEADKNVKLQLRELPVLGPNSQMAARAALAVNAIDKSKYFQYHSALMKFQGQKTEQVLMDQAKAIGIDPKELKEKMNKPEINEALGKNQQLAASLGISGTPGFLIGSELVPGAVDVNAFKDLIKKARGK